MVGTMMWFKREPKHNEKPSDNGVVNKFRRKKTVLLKPTRESSERETSTESDKERRRYSDILDMKVSQERREESDESLYESADCHSDARSASDDALPRLGKTPTISKESLKLAVTDEELDTVKQRKGHRKTMSLSNPLELVKNLGDELFDVARKELDKNSDKKKSRESLWSEEDRDSIHGSTMKIDQIRKNSKKEDKSQSNSRKSSTTDPPKQRKISKGSSVGALSFLRRKKTPTNSMPVESVAEDVVDATNTDEILNYTKLFLEGEKMHSSVNKNKPPIESDSEDEPPTPKQLSEHRRRLSRQTSRSKSKVRGKSQSLKVNTLRKSHSGTLKKGKKKSVKTPSSGRSRQASIVEQTPVPKKKYSGSLKQNSWLFSSHYRGDSRREGSTDEPTAPDADVDTSDPNTKEPDKDNNVRAGGGAGRGVNRAESCRERDAPRRGKHRNASDPNRLTAHNNHDLEPGAPTAPSGSSSSSSLSSRSNESNTVATEQQASQSDWSEEDEPLAAQWADSLPPHVLDSLVLSAKLRKRQEVIHELIVSEGSHVRWLKVLGGVFLHPLENQPSLISAEELRALFPNLPSVRERHAKLYAELRNVRDRANNHVVEIRPIAEALLNTLGEPGYAACLAKFCCGQRMALDALRERRRKNKELHQFLINREQMPLCGRLQLRDLLACVWQRLTKYQLLLESLLRTVPESESEHESASEADAADAALVQRAVEVARTVLHHVDAAIRAAENEHRLRTIQSKLEVRVSGGAGAGAEWDELRRLDLTHHSLRMEGELSIRNDTKKTTVLALMLQDALVLLQREGEKFLLKPIPQSSQQLLLSPLIKWDKVLFRPNAAMRNTFFLMNINGVQMHELSAHTTSEYTTWVKNIQEAPLAKLTELKPIITPSHQASRSNDDSGINVSRNPSDASEKSSSVGAPDEPTDDERRDEKRDERRDERRDEKRERDSAEPEVRSADADDKREEKKPLDSEVADREDKHKPRRPTVGRISTHGSSPAPLVEPKALTVTPPAPAHTAQRVLTHSEQLRRLDASISLALRAKSALVARALGVPPRCYAHVADLAVAESLGYLDVNKDLRTVRAQLSRSSSAEDDVPETAPDLHQLLLAAQTQANQLTEYLRQALSVNEATTVAARAARAARAERAPRGRCDRCRGGADSGGDADVPIDTERSFEIPDTIDVEEDVKLSDSISFVEKSLEKEMSFDMLADLEAPDTTESNGEDQLEASAGAAALATRLVGVACGLQGTLARALTALPAREADTRVLRAQLAALRDNNDTLRARRPEYQTTEDIPYPTADLDSSIQNQPSNGG